MVIFYKLYFTFYTLHFTLYTLHFTLYTLHFIFYHYVLSRYFVSLPEKKKRISMLRLNNIRPTWTILFFLNVNNMKARYIYFFNEKFQMKTLKNSKTLKNFVGWRFAIPMTPIRPCSKLS
jgi:hypothetical protein